MRPVRLHPRLWLMVCAWCLIGWTAPALASWEAYQRAGEAASSRGRYAAAERMFLAAVREARHFGPQDPRLDISLNQLALLRVTRGQHANAARRSQLTTSHTARQKRVSHRGRQRQQPRTALQRAPQLRRGQQLQRPRVVIRRAGPEHAGRRSRSGIKRQAARSPRRAMWHDGQPHRAQLGLRQGAMA